MVVENVVPIITQTGVTWLAPPEPRWSDYRDNRWYAWGPLSCIWLDENKVSYNDGSDYINHWESVPRLLLQGRLFETLKESQLYRPLTDYERILFLEIKACQADIMRYGQGASTCHSPYEYPVQTGKEPPEHIGAH